MTGMVRRRAKLSDDALDRRSPPLWRVWKVARANLIALVVVVLAYGVAGALVLYNGQQDQKRDDRQGQERRENICEAITEKAPDALARAFGQPTTNNPDLDAYKADLRETLGFCEAP